MKDYIDPEMKLRLINEIEKNRQLSKSFNASLLYQRYLKNLELRIIRLNKKLNSIDRELSRGFKFRPMSYWESRKKNCLEKKYRLESELPMAIDAVESEGLQPVTTMEALSKKYGVSKAYILKLSNGKNSKLKPKLEKILNKEVSDDNRTV